MKSFTFTYQVLLMLPCLLLLSLSAGADAFSLGVGREIITPEQDMWMAGYAARSAPSSGKVHDLWAKALTIQDSMGVRSVVVTLDLIGISAPVARATAKLAEERLGIPRERLMLTASHTHCGPVTRDNLIDMYGLNEEQTKNVDEYTQALPEHIYSAIVASIRDLEAGTLQRGTGHADFARNRRKYTPNGVINNLNPIGPVDHDVPVLMARRADGSIKGVLFGYAYHNTTLGFQQFSGDYAGFAQAWIETEMPGVTALFAAGCGGDQNPLPRRTLTLAELYGEELGKAVLKVMASPMDSVSGPIRATYDEISLRLSPAPSRAEIEVDLTDSSVYIQRRAKRLLSTLDERGALAETYPYPIQVWRFSDDYQITALGGEATVDYSLRIKKEFGEKRQFVIAYADDVCAYIPSLRVLREGGYEGADSMVYYGFYGPWAPSVEEDVMAAVHRLADSRGLINLHESKQLSEQRPILIAHRGGIVGPDSPECSRNAIMRASLAGYHMVELDIQSSKDEQPIVFHDRMLRPACDQDGSVADYRADVLQTMGFVKNGEAVLHLSDALALCAEERLGVMLDIKSKGSERFYRRILGLIERFELTRAAMCINGAPEISKHLGGHIMLRATNRRAADLSGSFWFGLASELTADDAHDMQARGALVIPAINTFRYNDTTHREDARADAQRLLTAEVDGFQIDSVYQDDFGLGEAVSSARAGQ